MNYSLGLRLWIGVFFVFLVVSSAMAQTPDAVIQPPASDSEECQSGGFYAGFAFVFAKPHFKESFQATYFDAGGTLCMAPFSYDYGLMPRTWFGYTAANGLGVRTRYWQYDHKPDPFQSNPYLPSQAHVVSVIFPAMISATPPNEILNVSDALEVQSLDVEGTQNVRLGNISLLAGGGLRYVLMRQESYATVSNQGAVVQWLSWLRKFEGMGPTVSIDVERPLGTRGLALVGAFRGSLLFGEKDLNRVEVNGSGGGPPVVALHDAAEVLGIGEIELGLQWTRRLAGGGGLFVRGAYEGQLWSDCGTPTLGYLGFQGFGLGLGFSR